MTDSEDSFSILAILFFIGALSLFGACSKQPEAHCSLVSLETIVEQTKAQAIPVPVGFAPVCDNPYVNNADSTTIELSSYEGELCVSDVLTFYQRVLESDGWNIQDMSAGAEGLLCCNKVNKCSVISIRTGLRRKTKVHVFTQDAQHPEISQPIDFNAKNIIL